MERLPDYRNATDIEYDTEINIVADTDPDMEPLPQTIDNGIPRWLWSWVAIVAMIAIAAVALLTGGRR